MAKKSRRLRTPNLPPEAYNAPTESGAPPQTGGGMEPSREAVSIDLREEYKGVFSDLRRTVFIFLGMVIAMIGLSFVIR
jgi:hypothetical protein